MKRLVLVGLTGALLVGACTSTTTTTRPRPEPDPIASTTTVVENGRTLEIIGCDSATGETDLVCEAWDLIHTRYVDPVTDSDLAAGAADGLALLDGTVATSPMVCVAPSEEFVEVCSAAPFEAEDTSEALEAMVFGMTSLALDPNSAYLDPDLLRLIRQEQDGQVEGIGALVSAEDGSSGEFHDCGVVSATCRLSIVSTIVGSPAEAAGVRKGDVIVGVDGEDITGWTIDEVTAAVRGRAGTEVSITVLRQQESIDFKITRAAVQIPVVMSESFGRVGYLRLNQFTDTAGPQMQEAFFDLLTEGIDTLVFDLRDNPGGLLTAAIDVASQFLADGEVVETVSPNKTSHYDVEGNPIVPDDVEVIVLVNKGSASASELLSALLQERGRATVIGENTFGKNTVQQQFDLSNGGALKLTVARWVTPGGLDFGQVGVTPDVLVDLPADLELQALVDLAISVS